MAQPGQATTKARFLERNGTKSKPERAVNFLSDGRSPYPFLKTDGSSPLARRTRLSRWYRRINSRNTLPSSKKGDVVDAVGQAVHTTKYKLSGWEITDESNRKRSEI